MTIFCYAMLQRCVLRSVSLNRLSQNCLTDWSTWHDRNSKFFISKSRATHARGRWRTAGVEVNLLLSYYSNGLCETNLVRSCFFLNEPLVPPCPRLLPATHTLSSSFIQSAAEFWHSSLTVKHFVLHFSALKGSVKKRFDWLIWFMFLSSSRGWRSSK